MNPQNQPKQAGPAPVPAAQPMASPPAGPSVAPVQGESDKQYLTAWFLSYFLGVFGVDRFYLGYTGLGIAKLLTFGGCGIWALVDWILIFAGVTKDRQGRPLKDREKHLKLTIIIFLVLFALGVISGAVNTVFLSKGVHDGMQMTPTSTTSSLVQPTPEPAKTTTPKAYTTVATFSGNGAKKSEPFTISGDRLKIAYDCTGSLCQAFLYKTQGQAMQGLIMNNAGNAKDETIFYGAGEYYIDANTIGTYTMTIQDYK